MAQWRSSYRTLDLRLEIAGCIASGFDFECYYGQVLQSSVFWYHKWQR